jgi:hypothetical protein
MERCRFTTAGVAFIGAVLLLGSGVWWLLALERERREQEQHLADWQDHESVLYQAPPVVDEDRAAILEVLGAAEGGPPAIVSWGAEPLRNLGKQGVKVVRVSYRDGPARQLVEDVFYVCRGKAFRLPGWPRNVRPGYEDGKTVCGKVSWREELKRLDRTLGFFESVKLNQ